MMQRLVQLALDLFDPPGPQERAAGASPTAAGPLAQKIKPKPPVAPVDKAQSAPENVANSALPSAAPAPALASLLSPAEFRHPQANREVLLGDALVAYALHRSRRRTIGFTVGADGLAVRAPSWVALSAVDTVLRERSAWKAAALCGPMACSCLTWGSPCRWCWMPRKAVAAGAGLCMPPHLMPRRGW